MSDALLFTSIKSSMYISLFSSSVSLNFLSACSINYWEKHTKISIKIYTNIYFIHKHKNVIIVDVYIFLCSVNFCFKYLRQYYFRKTREVKKQGCLSSIHWKTLKQNSRFKLVIIILYIYSTCFHTYAFLS